MGKMEKKRVKIGKTGSGKGKTIVLNVTENTTLMVFLLAQMPHKNRNNIKSLLSSKQVLADGQVVSKFNHPLAPGQKVEIYSERIPTEKKFREYTVVYEDHDLIVIDKQSGLLSIATENEKKITAYSLLSSHVKEQNPRNKIFIVHRLDRETSGLMLFAKSEPVKLKLQETWDSSIVSRNYVAVVEGEIEEPEGVITSYLYEDKTFVVHSSQNPAKGHKAVTHFTTIKKNKDYSLLKVCLETGRKNQIRVHMAEIGHSIAGDKKYGASANPLKRLGLHAQSLSFIHPASGKSMVFETPVPRAFLRLF